MSDEPFRTPSVLPWAACFTGPARWLRAAGATLATAAGTAVAVTVLTGTGTGTGFGRIAALGTPTRGHTWMSVTTDIGPALEHPLDADGIRKAVWLAGLLAAAAADRIRRIIAVRRATPAPGGPTDTIGATIIPVGGWANSMG
ncbi:hypothetical protein OHA21_07140 [Actinoplanes sp. NBC_00393]|uniref:hypothetical protein n=1 Tax=Actinoplanes sp. NBC_00393 TaxID=2975953 RepID=UPI002E23F8FD